jgi:hypothetical protein
VRKNVPGRRQAETYDLQKGRRNRQRMSGPLVPRKKNHGAEGRTVPLRPCARSDPSWRHGPPP